MISEQYFVFFVLGVVLVLFIWGRIRYDVVSMLALLTLAFTGIVPGDLAFYGFSHPAVITVAAILILTRGLLNSGLVDSLARIISQNSQGYFKQLVILVAAVSVSSAFMNNVGALALFMPVAIRLARKNNRPPSLFLMPLAFGSLLGGLTTQIGTPPNIIISIFRQETTTGVPFQIFDFTPVGAAVACAGILFIVLIGWRLIPVRKGATSPEDFFNIEGYVTEVYVPKGSKFAGKRLLDLGKATEGSIIVVGHIRNKRKVFFFSPFRTFEEGDHIVIKANAEDLQELLEVTGLELAASRKFSKEDLRSEEFSIVEAVVTANSSLLGQNARTINLRTIYGINLLGISREGAEMKASPDLIRFRTGDVLLLQGREEALREVMGALGTLPLEERGLKLGRPRRYILCAAIFFLALIAVVLRVVPIQIAFMSAAVLMFFTGFVSLRELYESVEWPVIVLLGAMIPVSNALETTGGAELIAGTILNFSGSFTPWVTLTVVLVATMFLSDLVNNAAAAVLMAPIAINTAVGLGVSTDPFLMAVAIGASCAFLTPIGHQSNTLVMGPGGYKFSDYWRMGLPLEVIITVVAIPMIMLVWPF